MPPERLAPLCFVTKFPQSYATQFRMVFWKFWMSYWRNPQYNATRFVFAGVLAFLVGSILWKVGHTKCAPDTMSAAGSADSTAKLDPLPKRAWRSRVSGGHKA